LSPAVFVIVAAAPAVVVAVNVTAASEAAEALSTFAPAAVPSVHEPTVAIPDASVVTDPLATEPPPLVTAKVTATPGIGAPVWSLTTIDGDGATTLPTPPVRVVTEFAVSDDGTAGPGPDGPPPSPPPQAMLASNTTIADDLAAITLNFFT
jgi:hypothetical protein